MQHAIWNVDCIQAVNTQDIAYELRVYCNNGSPSTIDGNFVVGSLQYVKKRKFTAINMDEGSPFLGDSMWMPCLIIWPGSHTSDLSRLGCVHSVRCMHPVRCILCQVHWSHQMGIEVGSHRQTQHSRNCRNPVKNFIETCHTML